MSQATDYRKKAADSREQAGRSRLPDDEAMWLKIADQWMRLANEAETEGNRW
jgi:hypothetical protein